MTIQSTLGNSFFDLSFLNNYTPYGSYRTIQTLMPRNNNDLYKNSYIYNSQSNLCVTFYKVGYKIRLQPCDEKNKYQQWYIPSQMANYWILSPTLSFYSDMNTQKQFEIEPNTIQNYFNENTVCLFISGGGHILTNYCLEPNTQSIQATVMDPVTYNDSQNKVKSSSVNGDLCLDVFSEDLPLYEYHNQQIKVSQLYQVNPNTLDVGMIRGYMNPCSDNPTSSSSQFFTVFGSFAELLNHQNSIFNPDNHAGITDIKVNRKNIFLKIKEVKNLNLDIFAGKTKISHYPNVSVKIDNNAVANFSRNSKAGLKVRSLKKKPSGITIMGNSVGSTALTINIHDKIVKLNVIVDNATDRITFLDIQTYKDFVGDAIMIQSTDPEGHLIHAMVDTGKASDVSIEKLLAYLDDNNILELEWILITHFHGDHYGGLSRLMKRGIKIGAIYMKEYHGLDSNYSALKYKDAEAYRKDRLKDWKAMLDDIEAHHIPIRYVSEGVNDEVSLGHYHFKFFNVEKVFQDYGDICAEFKNCNENTNSIVSVVSNQGKYYYLSGDIDTLSKSFNTSPDVNLKKAYQRRTVDKWVKKAMATFSIDHFDVFKAGHHGTLYNNIESTYVIGKPDVVIVTVEKQALRKRRTILERRAKSGNPNTQIYYSGNGIISVSQDAAGTLRVIQGIDEHG